MNANQTFPGSPEVPVKQENIARGLIGAILGGLVGVLVAFLLARVGYIASIAGLVGVFLAIKLYGKFAGGTSVKGIIIASVIAIVLVLAEVYFDYAFVLMQTYNELGAKVSFSKAFSRLPEVLKNGEVKSAFIKDLLLSALFAVIGSIALIIQSVKNVKNTGKAFAGKMDASVPTDSGVQQDQSNSFDYDPNKFN